MNKLTETTQDVQLLEETKADSWVSILELSEEISTLRQDPKYKNLYALNLFEYMEPWEPDVSAVLRCIFEYKDDDNRFVCFERFVEKFLVPIGFDLKIRNPKFYIEFHTEKKNRIDLLVDDKDYVIVFENKVRGADFQRNQLGRYINTITTQSDYSAKRHYLIILPQYYSNNYIDNIRTSVWRFPKKTNDCVCSDSFKCKCDDSKDLLCAGCTDYKENFRYRTLVIQLQLVKWLDELLNIISDRECILKSGIIQFSDYLKGLYQIRINNQLLMNAKDLVSGHIFAENDKATEKWKNLMGKIKDVQVLKNTLEAMKSDISKELIDEWYNQLKQEWPTLQIQRTPGEAFWIDVEGLRIGCWCSADDTDGYPYWGIFCKDGCNDEQRKIADAIYNESGITHARHKSDYLYWSTTQKGYERCSSLFEAARRFIKQG